MLFLSYIIGLWFTLRTHAATIWNTEQEEKKAHQAVAANGAAAPPSMHVSFSAPKPQGSGGSKDNRHGSQAIRDTHLYKRILTESLKQDGLGLRSPDNTKPPSTALQPGNPPHVVPPKTSDGESAETSSQRNVMIAGLSEEQSDSLIRQVAEMAATAATVAAQDLTRPGYRSSASKHDVKVRKHSVMTSTAPPAATHEEPDTTVVVETASGGHDAPNWSRTKSAVILLGATVLYAIIAEILVNTVDVVLANVDIDEKFLGITLFALVPNTTEFLVNDSALEHVTVADVCRTPSPLP